jgi:hypothetical protein
MAVALLSKNADQQQHDEDDHDGADAYVHSFSFCSRTDSFNRLSCTNRFRAVKPEKRV